MISLNIDSAPTGSALALSFTESPEFIRPTFSDDSSFPSANTTYDGVLRVKTPLVAGLWQQPAGSLRGGFRYLTLVSNSNSPLTLSNVTCEISFMPHFPDLRAYTGYFSAKHPTFHDEDFLTKSCVYHLPLKLFSLLIDYYSFSLVRGWIYCSDKHSSFEYWASCTVCACRE